MFSAADGAQYWQAQAIPPVLLPERAQKDGGVRMSPFPFLVVAPRLLGQRLDVDAQDVSINVGVAVSPVGLREEDVAELDRHAVFVAIGSADINIYKERDWDDLQRREAETWVRQECARMQSWARGQRMEVWLTTMAEVIGVGVFSVAAVFHLLMGSVLALSFFRQSDTWVLGLAVLLMGRGGAVRYLGAARCSSASSPACDEQAGAGLAGR